MQDGRQHGYETTRLSTDLCQRPHLRDIGANAAKGFGKLQCEWAAWRLLSFLNISDQDKLELYLYVAVLGWMVTLETLLASGQICCTHGSHS